jgi:GalNAc-alpha-(1->4)-GalNAc-alpha-(1->3)-diNAcBac-PP-undecaprenol alpha-1,4-N-acetyl-D-galactosaminyltransferase
MKILFAVKTMDSRGGGAERVLAQVTSALVQRGHDVTLLTFDSPVSPDFYPIDRDVRRIWLNAGRQQARTSASDLIKRVTALRAAFRNDAPDVAIGFMHSAYIPLALAALGQSIPVVASEHIVWSYFGDRPLDRLVLRGTARLYAATTFVSAGDEQGFPRAMARRSTVISNPIQDLTAACADPSGGPSKTLLSVGRLTHQKDQATLIDAFARIADRYPHWRLRIVGEGELRGALESQVERVGLAGRVELPGAVRDICNEYAQAQLFVLPSRYESFGLATAEALAAGLPAVGFADCPGTNALIAHESNGLLVSGSDRVAALAEALDRLMASAVDRTRLGSAGPASVQQFALPRIVSAWEALLRGLDLGRARKAAA